MITAAPWSVVVPLAGGAIALVVSRRQSRAIGFATGGATLGLAMLVAFEVWSSGPRRLALGGWDAPLGIGLHADGLTVVMLLMNAVVAAGIVMFASGYFDHSDAGKKENRATEWRPYVGFWPLLLFAWGGTNALYLTSDFFNAYVAFELMTIAAVALVVLTDAPVVLTAGIRYLLAAFVGSLAFLLGVALLYATFDTLDLVLLGERFTAGPSSWMALALITTGLALKTALFPLHFWLPRAHAGAPAPVSALLSALVVTASFYFVLRLWVFVLTPAVTTALAQAIGVAGAAAILWGSIQAIRQQHLKLMIAYSTVAQIGYLFLIFPLMTGGGAAASMAWSGGLYHAITHAFAKAAMFMAAGSVVYSIGSDRIVGLSGIASRLPISTYAFGIAGLSLIGLPPTGGFVAKWLLLSSAIESGQWWWAAVVLAGGVLTAGYVFLVLGQELSLSKAEVTPEFRPVPRAMEYAAMTLALISLVLGFRAIEILDLLDVGSPFISGAIP
jgi:multicomponent Na+:H+ antiporter subunit D